MRRDVLLACLVTTLAFPVPVLADGVIRFSGRIVEAPCAPSVPSSGEVLLTGCSAAAEGATLSIQALGPAAEVRLIDVSSGSGASVLPVGAAALTPDRRHFSSRYRIESAIPDGSGSYLVSVDYL